MSHLLIIEDDRTLAINLRDYLIAQGYEVTLAPDLNTAKGLKINFDLIILDWMLPDGQGPDYLRGLRSQSIWIPVLFLTAKAELIDKILGLESGAHDYIVKPFDPRELLARLRVHLRKRESQNEILSNHQIDLDTKSREVKYQGHLIEMTRKEFDLLHLLMSEPNKVFSRDELPNKVWGFDNFPTTRTVDTHVLQLRQKLSDDLIQTVRGIGYRIKADD